MKNYTERISGWINKKGTFNDNEYDNLYLVVIGSENGVPVTCDCKNYKFKKENCEDVLGFKYDPDQLDDLIGVSIAKPYFNKFGQLIGVDYE